MNAVTIQKKSHKMNVFLKPKLLESLAKKMIIYIKYMI